MDIKVNEQTVIVFDLDDTLYNEIDYLKSAYTELAKQLEPENWQHTFSRLFSLYRNQQNVFEYVSKTYALSLEDLIQRYRNHIPDIKPFDNVLSVMQKIKNNKGKIAIVTDGRKITQSNKIKQLGLTSHVDFTVISEEIGSEKPSEHNFKAVENHFQLKNYYYIGDNFKKDFITPKKLGWQTVALIDQGLNIHSNAHAYNETKYLPNFYLSSFSNLVIN